MQLVNPFIFASTPKTWTFIDSTTSNSGTITLPASIDAGDLLVIAHATWEGTGGGTSQPSLITPSGFTNKFDESYEAGTPGNYNARVVVSCKIATGTEDSSSVNVVNGAARERSVCLQFRPNFSISSISNITLGSTVVENSGPADPSAITTVPTGVKTPSVALAISADLDNSSNSATLSTQSPTFDGSVAAPFSTFIFHYRVENDGATAQTVDMSDKGNYNYLMVTHLYDNGV